MGWPCTINSSDILRCYQEFVAHLTCCHKRDGLGKPDLYGTDWPKSSHFSRWRQVISTLRLGLCHGPIAEFVVLYVVCLGAQRKLKSLRLLENSITSFQLLIVKLADHLLRIPARSVARVEFSRREISKPSRAVISKRSQHSRARR